MKDTLLCMREYLVSNLIFVVILSFNINSMFAQQMEIQQTEKSYTLLFKVDCQTIDTTYCSNSTILNKLEAELDKLLTTAEATVDSVVIVSSASPDGDSRYNYRLSVERGHSVYSYLRANHSGYPEERWVLQPKGEDWLTFRHLLNEDDSLPFRQELLDVVDADYSMDGKERQIKKLKQAYAYLAEHHLYKLRAVTVIVYTSVREAVMSSPVLAWPAGWKEKMSPFLENQLALREESAEKKRFRLPPFAVKTNLLYDAALVPNIGLEYFFKERWSVALNWMYAWWKTDRRHYYWRVYGGDVEARYWLGKEGYGNCRSGHHVGVYAQTGTFDFELGGRGYMIDDWGYGGGFSYGYSLPVARNLNLDFSVGLGVFHGVCKEYLPIDGHYVWQVTKNINWIGPTKFEVSLVWHIGDKNWRK